MGFRLVLIFVLSIVHVSCGAPSAKRFESATSSSFSFQQVNRAQMNAKGYRVYAHWHSYHLTQWNKATQKDEFAEMLRPVNTIFGDGREVDMGGLLRDRPIPRPVPPPPNAYQDEAKVDVELAANVGIDGFFVNVHFLNPNDGRWNDNVGTLFDQADKFSAENDPGFSIAINVDGIAVKSFPNYDSAGAIDALAAKIASYKNRRSYMKMNGKFVLGAALPEQVPASYWQNLVAALQRDHAMPIAFVPSYNTFPAGYQDSLKSITAASNKWGMYHHTATTSAVSAWNDANNIPFIPSVTTQDNRPKIYKTTETAGFKSQFMTWDAAIKEGHKAVMILTWNDYAEGHHARPSTALQYAMYDLIGYYATWFKTRARPAVSSDTIFYAHRMHRTDAKITKQPQKTVSSIPEQAPLLDKVYALAFLAQPGQIQIVNGDGKTHLSGPLPEGVHFFEAPLVSNSQPVFRILSSDGASVRAEVKSAFRVRGDVVQWEDLMYRAGGSNRPPVEGVQDDIPEERQ